MKKYIILFFTITILTELCSQNNYTHWEQSFIDALVKQRDTMSHIKKMFVEAEWNDYKQLSKNCNLFVKYFFETLPLSFFADTLLMIYKGNNYHPMTDWIYVIKKDFIELYTIQTMGWAIHKRWHVNQMDAIKHIERCLQEQQCDNFKNEWELGDRPIIFSKFVSNDIQVKYLFSFCQFYEDCFDEIRKK